MGYAQLSTRAQIGMHSPRVSVEVHVSNGLPMMNIVGMAETSVKESRDRVRSAISNSGYNFPSAKRILISLSPADLPKASGRYDLSIAIGLLAATGQINLDKFDDYCFAGELGLNGELRTFNGVLPLAIAAIKAKQQLVVPMQCADELRLLAMQNQKGIWGAKHLGELCDLLRKNAPLTAITLQQTTSSRSHISTPDLAHVKGQHQARRVLEIAASGGHNLLMSGPPGAGKTMLASCMPGILPVLTNQEALEVAAVYSIAGRNFDFVNQSVRPFRNPHHTASGVALVGGGGNPKPGEISLAHHGVLFLDEITEYAHQVLNVLREPLESGEIRISRAAMQVRYPARFQLIAAMNPCPCGYFGNQASSPSSKEQNRVCTCTPEQITRYQSRISGPLLDRIDLHMRVNQVKKEELIGNTTQGEPSEQVAIRVQQTRQLQLARQGTVNNAASAEDIENLCQLDGQSHQYLQRIFDNLNLSARSYHRMLRVARTIADMQQATQVKQSHLLEAVSYRRHE